MHDLIGIIRAIDWAPQVVRAAEDGAGKEDKSGGDGGELLGETTQRCHLPSRPLEKLSAADAVNLKEFTPSFEKLLDHLISVQLRPSPVNKEELVTVHTLEDFQKTLNGFSLDRAANITLQGLLRRLSLALEAYAFDAEDNDADAQTCQTLAIRVENISKALNVLWSPEVAQSSKKFRAVITDSGQSAIDPTAVPKRASILGDKWAQAANSPRKLCFWSFAAHVALLPFFGAGGSGCENSDPCHSLIITSGTLKPLDAQELQLGDNYVKFPIQLENQHVIDDHQLFTGIVGTGPRGNRMLMTYDVSVCVPGCVRVCLSVSECLQVCLSVSSALLHCWLQSLKNNKGIFDDLGQIIIDACKMIRKDGILVFFPSYAQMNRSVET